MLERYWLNFLISLLVSDFKIFQEQTFPGLEVSMDYSRALNWMISSRMDLSAERIPIGSKNNWIEQNLLHSRQTASQLNGFCKSCTKLKVEKCLGWMSISWALRTFSLRPYCTSKKIFCWLCKHFLQKWYHAILGA